MLSTSKKPTPCSASPSRAIRSALGDLHSRLPRHLAPSSHQSKSAHSASFNAVPDLEHFLNFLVTRLFYTSFCMLVNTRGGRRAVHRPPQPPREGLEVAIKLPVQETAEASS
jgi:hypothetical protein